MYPSIPLGNHTHPQADITLGRHPQADTNPSPRQIPLPRQTTPPPQALRDMVNKRAVRILLEYILVTCGWDLAPI